MDTDDADAEGRVAVFQMQVDGPLPGQREIDEENAEAKTGLPWALATNDG